jgi:hypothetical protein
MSITDKISKHYQTAIGGELKKFKVDEWDTEIYYRTTYPLKDEARIISLQTENKTIEALVESIIVKARDENGKRLFHDADRIKLMNEADPEVVIKVATVLNNAKIQGSQSDIAKE